MRRGLVGLVAVVGLASLPSSMNAQVTPGRVVWHDLVTRDVDASKAFYGALFGWTWRAPTFGKDLVYVDWREGGRGHGGHLGGT